MTLAMPPWAHIDRQWIMDQGIVVATGPGNLSRPEAEGTIPSSRARHKQQQQATEQTSHRSILFPDAETARKSGCPVSIRPMPICSKRSRRTSCGPLVWLGHPFVSCRSVLLTLCEELNASLIDDGGRHFVQLCYRSERKAGGGRVIRTPVSTHLQI
jgi:hypothetical protein